MLTEIKQQFSNKYRKERPSTMIRLSGCSPSFVTKGLCQVVYNDKYILVSEDDTVEFEKEL